MGGFSLNFDKSPAQTRVCVAMSGGVDSSAAAVLLKQQGYDVFGLTMDLLDAPYRPRSSSVADAAKVAEQIGIEHHFIDFRRLFADKVVNYFTSSYLNGETPSPCILCNRHIKLGALADKARELGADLIVTGHYAEIKSGPAGIELHRGKDLQKDQSYFLFDIERRNLEMLRCPLAGFSKEQTRQIARAAGLEVSEKSDSQDICFVAEGKYAELIKKLRPEFQNEPGDIVDTAGKIIGRHKGLVNYTVGQRRGLGIGGDIGILYVLKLEPRVHHAQPLVVAAEVLALLAHGPVEPLPDAGVVDVVVVDPALVAGVVRRIDVDAVDPTLVLGQQGLQGLEVVAVDDHVPAVRAVAVEHALLGHALEHAVRDVAVVVDHLLLAHPVESRH